MIKNDQWIREKAQGGMIVPFCPGMIRDRLGKKVISYGLGSYGYDIRLAADDFRIFVGAATYVDPYDSTELIVDPKEFNPGVLRSVIARKDDSGTYFTIPPHTYALGYAKEQLTMPSNVTAICIGKSTYARAGIIVNMTPVEAGWRGHLTIEISNSTSAPCRVYADEGIAQLLFFEGEDCNVCYDTREGKYQAQPAQVVLPVV